MKDSGTVYEDLFLRNYGVFTREQQDRLRRARVLVVGCGGIGGTVSVILARSGVQRFRLVDPDVFEPTNMNRQIGCTVDTIGRNKAEALAEAIGKVNPAAEVEAVPRALTLGEVKEKMRGCDLVFPAADDYAYSIMVFRQARKAGRHALMIVPAGLWSLVTILGPTGPAADDMHAIPPVRSYEELREVFEKKKYKMATYFYPWLGGWRRDYYREFIDEDAPVTQICPSVWLASSLGALEAVKLLSGKEKPVTAPWYWSITRRGIRKQHLRGLNVQTLMHLHRKVAWRIFRSPLGGLQAALQKLWWEKWFNR